MMKSSGGDFLPSCVNAAVTLLSVDVFSFFNPKVYFALRCYLLSNRYLGKTFWLCLNVFVNV